VTKRVNLALRERKIANFGVTPRQGASGQSFSKRIEFEARGCMPTFASFSVGGR
jgi:hypothetical protein